MLKVMLPRDILKDRLFCAGFGLGGFFILLTLWFGLGMDHSIFCYSVWVWKHYGLPPYIGAWDHAFPGIYFIHLLALELFGDSVLGFRFFDFLVQLAALPMIFYLAKRLAGLSLAGFFATVSYGIYYYDLGVSATAQRESYIFCILLAAVTIALASEKKFRLRAAIIGLLLGFAFMLKPFFGLAWPVFGVFLLAAGLRQKRARCWTGLALFALGCCLPAALFAVTYWRLGYGRELYYAAVWFNAQIYSKMTADSEPRLAFWREALFLLFIKNTRLIIWPAVLVALIEFRKGRLARDRKMFRLILSLTMVSLLSYAIQRKYFAYHLAPAMGCAIIFAGWAFAALSHALKKSFHTRLAQKGVATVNVLIILLILAQTGPVSKIFAFKYAFRSLDKAYLAWYATDWDKHLGANYFATAKYLEPRLKPEDTIACFGPYPLIPYLLHRKLPTYYPCAHHLLLMRSDGKVLPRQRELIKQYSDQVIAARPRFIVISDAFPGQKQPGFKFMSPNPGLALDRQFRPLKKFIARNYHLQKTINHVYIYEMGSQLKN